MQLGTSSRRIVCGAVVAAAILACNDTVAGLGPPSDPATETFAPALNVDIPTMTLLASGVYVRDSVVGTGDEVVALSDTIVLNYAGWLKDGTLFDSGNNSTFLRGGVVAGMRNGVVGMKVGGTRGYGGASLKEPDGTIKVPRQSTLIFNVTLLRVHTPTTTTPPVALRGN
jgi:FKBP-type peptidyl-prolyl cis-trans isomerase